MKFLSLFSVFVCVCLFVGVNAGTFFDTEGYTYFISHPMKKNWYQAFRYCLYQGLTLIAINSQEENNRIFAALKSTNLTREQIPAIWTSGTDLGDNGNFYWASTGHAILYTDYSPGQPDNVNRSEHCLEIRLRYDSKWNDVTCDAQLHFVCRGNNTNIRFELESD